jgi:coproporphyrinogen III oxidase-like Fe-S oxidoreductase
MTFRDVLVERMARPQRHRLLQGFPAVPAMVPAGPHSTHLPLRARRQHHDGLVRHLDGRLDDVSFRDATDGLAKGPPPPLALSPDTPERRAFIARAAENWSAAEAVWRSIVDAGDRSEPVLFDIDTSRDLIVGVIPHTQCIPRTEGCGFCTFPHDVANKHTRADMIASVVSDINTVTRNGPLQGRKVSAIYLGGGTANLSSTEEIASLVQALASHLRIDDAELTLEGTPQLFEQWFSSHLKNLANQPVGPRRISMGIQTFDEAFLRRMGREKFGDESTVRKLVKKCRALDITTSGDFLFNLPGQTAAQMDHDVDTAVAAGLDQICLYNLVLYKGLGTPWSKDEALVARMPGNDDACANWLRLRERLIAAGYVQTTLTNFERDDVASGPRRFRYEAASFTAEHTDGVGFGPMSLSTFVNWQQRRGLKLLRRKNVAGPPWSGEDLMYRYDEGGLKGLWLTRGLAKTRVDGAVYQRLFSVRLVDDLQAPMQACIDLGLLEVAGSDVRLTPTGMFYADAVVSTLTTGLTSSTGAGLHTLDLLRERPQTNDYIGMG